jgi:Ribonuclease G/E
MSIAAISTFYEIIRESLRFRTEAAKYLRPGDAAGAIAIDFIQSPVEFLALRVGEPKCA